MKVLVAMRMNGEVHEHLAADSAKAWLLSRLVAVPDSVVQRDNEIDWHTLRTTHGGFGAAYRWAADTYDKLVMIEHVVGLDDAPVIAKGQYTMAQYFLERGKGVGVWRPDGMHKVVALRVYDRHNWKAGYGQVVLAA